MGNNSNETNCTQLSVDELLKITIAYSAAGGIGVLVAGMILIVLTYARAYKTILQRLVIYSVLTVLFQDSCHLANIVEYPHWHKVNASQLNESNRDQCAWLGFMTNWCGWSQYMFYLAIIFYLLGVLCVQVKGSTGRKRLKAWKTRFEVLCILSCVLLPGLVLWIPIRNKKYGQDIGPCFFEIACNYSKQKGHFWYIFFFYFFVFELIGLLCVLIAIGLFIVYCVLSSKLRLQRAKLMMKYLIVLLTAVILNSVILNIIVVGYTNNLIANKLRMFTVVFATADDFVFLSGYLLVFYYSKVSTTVRGLSKHKAVKLKEYRTFKESDRETAPSETRWSKSAPYTGAFSSVTIQNE